MDAEHFTRAITVGIGRAVLWLRAHPWQPHADAIAQACLHNTAYDPQCEGRRTEYVHEIVSLTDTPGHFADLTVQALLGTQETYWDMVHLFDLARRFAQDGHAAARAALHERFERSDAQEPFIGGEQLVALDGVPGLLTVLDRIGRYLPEHPNYWVDDRILQEAEEYLSAEVIASAVRDGAAANPNVRRFVDAAEQYRQYVSGPPRSTFRDLPWPDMKAKIAAGDVSRGWLFGWGRHATAEDVSAAASDLLGETDDRRLLAYVRLFSQRAFPLDPQRLVELASSGNADMSTAARRALHHVQHPAVRALALARLPEPGADGDDVELLARNYATGDERLIESLLDRQQADEDAFHGVARAAVRVFEQLPHADTLTALLNVYERCRCSICRLGAVDILIGQQRLPTWMLEECRHDSNPDIRETVAATARDRQA